MRWAYTQPIVEKDNLQSNFNLSTGQQILAQDGDRESRALYKSYMKGFEPRLGFAYRAGDRWVFRGGYGITQYMEGTGANLRLPLNPPYFFESAVGLQRYNRPGHARHGLCRIASARPTIWTGPRVGSEPAPAVHPAVERVRRVPADAVDVGQHRLRRSQCRSSGDARRRQPAAAWSRQSVDLGRLLTTAVLSMRPRRSSPISRPLRRVAGAITTRCR